MLTPERGWSGGIRILLGCVMLILCGLTPGWGAALRTYDLPEGEASQTLRLFAEVSDQEILFATQVVRGVTTNAVRGDYIALEALERMLAETRLQAVPDEASGAIAVRLIPRSAAPPSSRSATTVVQPRPARNGNHASDDPESMKLKNPITLLATLFALVVSPGNSAESASLDTGIIGGRIFNESTGTYLQNARVTVAEASLETFTDSFGYYTFPSVPIGDTQVRAFFTGLPVQEKSVTVQKARQVQVDFVFDGAASDEAGGVVKLDNYAVTVSRFMSADSTAVNEQRFSQNIKTVVAAESFGDNADGNLGEFVKFIPGITLGFTGGQASSISVGGLPPESTPITIGGNRLASAAGETRAIQLDQISLNNMAQVEVERSQNADSPADAIGGSVNLVPKSAFQRKQASYFGKIYAVFRDKALSDKTYSLRPSYELGAVVPLNERFGFAINGTSTEQDSAQYISNQAWVPLTLPPSGSLPAATSAQPYLGRYQFGDAPKTVARRSAGFTADFRMTPRDVITFGLQYGNFNEALHGVPRDQMIISPTVVVASSPDFTQGASGAGVLQLPYSTRDVQGATSMPTLRWRHTGVDWTIDLNAALSRSSYHDTSVSNGYFGSLNAFMRNVTVRFDDTSYLRPDSITVTRPDGQLVDITDMNNYLLENGGSNEIVRHDKVRSLSAFVQRELQLRFPLRLKTGLDYREQNRDIRSAANNFTYVGADGIARTADDSVAQWLDTSYLDRDEPWGLPKRAGFSSTKVYDTFKQHPEYFTETESNKVTSYRSDVTASKKLTESILAPYIRLDLKQLMNTRLNITGGLRYEQTEFEGVGPLINPNLIYQRDANGVIVLNGSGQSVAIAPLSTLAGTKLAYVERGAQTKRSYGDLFPSLNAAYHFLPNLIGRVAYARSIARPNFNTILPSISIPDETTPAAKTITLTNSNLDPWTADSYTLSIEYYFDEPSAGVVSLRAYRRDITDFWGAVTTPVTDEFLSIYGLDPSVYGGQFGYIVSTRQNAGDARVQGLELDYRQSISFLPGWGKGLSVFGNLTMQDLKGSKTADFTNFVERTINYGLSFNRSRFTSRVGVNLRGRERRELYTGAGSEPGTYNFLAPRKTVDVSVEYQVTRAIVVYASARNLFNAPEDRQRYGPSTPDYAKLQIRTDYRPLFVAGIKGSF